MHCAHVEQDFSFDPSLVLPALLSLTSLNPPPLLPPSSHCDYYTGSMCSAYIDRSHMVFIDGASADGDIGSLQQQVLKLFQKIERHDNRSVVDSTLKTKCSKLAKSIACHSSFPYCHPNMTTPTPRPVCKSTCDNFAVGGACYSYLNAADTPELYSRLMFNCDSRESPGGTEPECIPISSETAETGEDERLRGKEKDWKERKEERRGERERKRERERERERERGQRYST